MKSRIWLALLAIYIAWGSTYLAIHFAVESIPPFFMAGTRFLIAGLLVYGWRRMAGDPLPTRAQWRSAAIIGLFLLVVNAAMLGLVALLLSGFSIPGGFWTAVGASLIVSLTGWVASGLMVAERQFRKVIGYQQIPTLLSAFAATSKKGVAREAAVA